MSDLVRRLRDPEFGTETSERNLMIQAAAEIARLHAALDVVRASGLLIGSTTLHDRVRTVVHAALTQEKQVPTAIDLIRAEVLEEAAMELDRRGFKELADTAIRALKEAT